MAESTDNSTTSMEARLAPVVDRFLTGARVAGLTRLTGGASQQMWCLDAVTEDQVIPLVLRQASTWKQDGEAALSLTDEARLVRQVADAGLPVPRVLAILEPGDGLGSGYLMERLAGETLPTRILRDERYSTARGGLARRCGEVLAQIHRLETRTLAFLASATPAAALDAMYRDYRHQGESRPMFELAFRWLRDHLPEPPQTLSLVHGDFRHGNLMINEQGLVSVLDWELAYLGDPMADLGWICVNSWRFGRIDLPVGGFGSREQLFDGYESVSGIRPDPDRVRFWEIFGTLRWGVMCQGMAASFVAGHDTSPERGAIGRRASETEVDLLRYLVPLTT